VLSSQALPQCETNLKLAFAYGPPGSWVRAGKMPVGCAANHLNRQRGELNWIGQFS
jgi:hypothetical protein